MGGFFFSAVGRLRCTIVSCGCWFPPPFQSEVALANQKLVRSLDKGLYTLRTNGPAGPLVRL